MKPFIFTGSKHSQYVKVLDPITLEIVCQYRFKDFSGGFTNAEVLGNLNYENGMQEGQALAVSTTDNEVRFIDIRNISNHRRDLKTFKENHHNTTEIIINEGAPAIKIPEELICMTSSFILGSNNAFQLCVMSLFSKQT